MFIKKRDRHEETFCSVASVQACTNIPFSIILHFPLYCCIILDAPNNKTVFLELETRSTEIWRKNKKDTNMVPNALC